MLIGFDDYPIHQTAYPLIQAGFGHPDQYDRLWLNGFRDDLVFGVSFARYPDRQLVEGAFSVLRDGRRSSVYAGGRMNPDPVDTRVGPISVEIDGDEIRLDDGIRATEDRSWGIRAVGAPDGSPRISVPLGATAFRRRVLPLPDLRTRRRHPLTHRGFRQFLDRTSEVDRTRLDPRGTESSKQSSKQS